MSLLRQCLVLLGSALLVWSEEGADIDVECRNSSVRVTWRVNKDLAETPSRLFLGRCFPSSFSRTPDGGGKAVFDYHLSDCGFRKKRTYSRLFYQSVLSFRPLPKPHPPAFTHPVQCVSERPKWVQPFVKPVVGGLEGQGNLSFAMALLDDDLCGPAESSSFALGSFINIGVAVEQQVHQPLMLHLQECLASTHPTLKAGSQTYRFISNKGCLMDSKTGSSRFLPRFHSSSLLLQLQAFTFALEKPLYIHCTLVVWDPEDLNEGKKTCDYNKELGEWELLDDPSQNELCGCCDSSCGPPDLPGRAQKVVLGPLIVTARSRSDGSISRWKM